MFHVRNSFKAWYWKSEEEALDLIVRRTRCGRRRGLLSPTTDCMTILQQLTLRTVNGLAPCCANPVSHGSKRSCRRVTALHLDSQQAAAEFWSKHAAYVQKRDNCLHDDPPQAQATQNTTWNAARRIVIYSHNKWRNIYRVLWTVNCVLCSVRYDLHPIIESGFRRKREMYLRLPLWRWRLIGARHVKMCMETSRRYKLYGDIK